MPRLNSWSKEFVTIKKYCCFTLLSVVVICYRATDNQNICSWQILFPLPCLAASCSYFHISFYSPFSPGNIYQPLSSYQHKQSQRACNDNTILKQVSFPRFLIRLPLYKEILEPPLLPEQPIQRTWYAVS